MKRLGVRAFSLTSTLFGLILLVSAIAPAASAAGLDDFVTMLRSGGLQATSTGVLQHAGLSIGGQAIVVSQAANQTQVELFDYPDQAKMLNDWQVKAGAPVTAKASIAGVSGRLAMNNGTKILVFDGVSTSGDSGPNNDALVRSVGQAFLSLTTATSGPPSVAFLVEPPHTGNANLLSGGSHQAQTLPFWAGAIWTAISLAPLLLIVTGGLYLLRRLYR